MKQFINPGKETWRQLCQRPQLDLDYLDGTVKNILARVKKSGDKALQELTLQFDKVSIETLAATEQEFLTAEALLAEDLKNSKPDGENATCVSSNRSNLSIGFS